MKNYLTTFLCVFFVSISLHSQEVQSDFSDSKSAKKWGFSITPYALLAAQSTDVGGQQLRQSFSDLSSITNAGFQIISTVRYDRFSFSFDGTFATLGVDESQGPIEVDVTIRQNIFDFKLGYRVLDYFKLDDNKAIDGWSLDFDIGAKYWLNDVDIAYTLIWNDTPLLNGALNEKQEWWDLMVGVNTKFIVSPKFLVSVAYNAGGFGIGNSSKFAQDFSYINSFKVHNMVLVNAGFRSFMYKRTDIQDGEDLNTKVSVLGPLLGVSVLF